MSFHEHNLLNRVYKAVRKLWLNRYTLSFLYLHGKGIEIGALHNPLKVSHRARVSYVDRMSVAELRQHYPELRDKQLVTVDVVTDGELLEGIADASQQFVIANHFVEHCESPIRALENMFRVLCPGGILYLALPDKRYTFDQNRPVTPLAHLIRDYDEGPEWSRQEHFREWVCYVNGVSDPVQVQCQTEHLLAMEYSIHYHVWTQRDMMELLLHLQKRIDFDIEVMHRCKNEVIFIIRKKTE